MFVIKKDISFSKIDFFIILNNIISHGFQSEFYGLGSNDGWCDYPLTLDHKVNEISYSMMLFIIRKLRYWKIIFFSNTNSFDLWMTWII